jgi:hypothetical protein
MQSWPVLDENAFQQLLAAAYVLDGCTNRLHQKNAEFHCGQNVQRVHEHRKTIVGGTQEVLAKEKKLRASCKTVLAETGTQAKHSNATLHNLQNDQSTPRRSFIFAKSFWKCAAVVSAASVLSLLVGTSAYRLPLPTSFSSLHAGQQPVPAEKTIAVPPLSFSSFRPLDAGAEVRFKMKVMKRNIPIAADRALTQAATPFPNVKPHRPHPGRSVEPDMIAKDIVIRHGIASAQVAPKP